MQGMIAERSKSLYSGRSRILPARVRIPLLSKLLVVFIIINLLACLKQLFEEKEKWTCKVVDRGPNWEIVKNRLGKNRGVPPRLVCTIFSRSFFFDFFLQVLIGDLI